ncbi:MAG: hypothetical protein ABFD65_13895 [Candidatus Polarisedimenticolia bacterium]
MSKPVIAWAVRREWGLYYIIGLTKLGKFATEAEAREAAARHSATLARHEPEIARLRKALEHAERVARAEADAAFGGEKLP